MVRVHRRRKRYRRAQGTADTKIELLVKQILDAQEIHYTQQAHVGPYYVDFLLPELRIALEVDGCYWHKCLQCGYHPSARKVQYAIRRDTILIAAGLRPVHLLEHMLVGDPLPIVTKAIGIETRTTIEH